MNNADFKQRFLFPETDIRGELVRLDESLEAILGTHDYPLAVQGLVGEAVAATDVDGDGCDDVVIGAPGSDGGAGRVYVLGLRPSD